jgi:hypothetical protein
LSCCLTGLVQSVLKIKIKIVSSLIADSKPVKQEVNGTAILPFMVLRGTVNGRSKKSLGRPALAAGT